MPKKAMQPSVSAEDAAPGGVAAVDRALSLLAAFTGERPVLTLAELADRTRQYKSTVLRLLASLEHSHLVQRREDGRFSLGSTVARLHAVYAVSFSFETAVMPALRALVAATRESAAFHVRQGKQRLCLHRVDSNQLLRDHTRVGDLLPLERGTGGRVLMAYSGARGARYDKIRQSQVLISTGDRIPELAGIGAPVFDVHGHIAGVVVLTMPVPRLKTAHSADVLHAARRITGNLGGIYPAPE